MICADVLNVFICNDTYVENEVAEQLMQLEEEELNKFDGVCDY